MTQPIVRSIQVGKPANHGSGGETWRTGIFKEAVRGPIWVGRENLVGDGQESLTVHGGADRAVLGYSAGHYPAWRREFPEFTFPFGCFGENLTIDGLDETTVAIGDTHRIGPVVLQVTTPRAPCGNIARRCGIPSLLDRVLETGWFGWLYRVLAEGEIAAGMSLEVVEAPSTRWTVARVQMVRERLKARDEAVAEEGLAIAALPTLAESWRLSIPKLVERLRT